jgi:2-methylcitrate dehydratase PrpD
MDSEHASLDPFVADLGTRWEILDTGITVKLHPSCAATHPSLDVLLDIRRRHTLDSDLIECLDVEVDSMTPRLLLYDRPTTGLEAKFSMPFCAAAALVHGRIGVDTFDAARIHEPAVQQLMGRVTMRANPAFDAAAPLSRTRVTVRLRDGRVLTQDGDGARGYPGRFTDDELRSKFRDCTRRSLSPAAIDRAWDALKTIETIGDVRELTALLGSQEASLGNAAHSK